MRIEDLEALLNDPEITPPLPDRCCGHCIHWKAGVEILGQRLTPNSYAMTRRTGWCRRFPQHVEIDGNEICGEFQPKEG